MRVIAEALAEQILAAAEGRKGPVARAIANGGFLLLGLVGFCVSQLVVAAVLVGIGAVCPWLGRFAESSLIFHP